MSGNANTAAPMAAAVLTPLGSISLSSSHMHFFAFFTLSLLLLYLLRQLLLSSHCANLALHLLRFTGAIPAHICVIMDGNRRWGRCNLGTDADVSQAHARGGEKLSSLLKWCTQAGIKTVTVYAFSLENFKRPQQEVHALMHLARDKLLELLTLHERQKTCRECNLQNGCTHSHEHAQERVQIRVGVLGEIEDERVPQDVKNAAAKVIVGTTTEDAECNRKHFDEEELCLNVAFCYAGRRDIARAVGRAVELTDKGLLRTEDIDECVLQALLSTGFANGGHENMPQLLIRTSGETRLSDFLLWECTHAQLAFYHAFWPEFCAWDLVKILLAWQRTRPVTRSGYSNSSTKKISALEERVVNILREERKKYFEYMRTLAM